MSAAWCLAPATYRSLRWAEATYNGDQMSMYGVNAGVPKTLVRHLTAYFASEADSEAVRKPFA